jgi:hypothetical protein
LFGAKRGAKLPSRCTVADHCLTKVPWRPITLLKRPPELAASFIAAPINEVVGASLAADTVGRRVRFSGLA